MKVDKVFSIHATCVFTLGLSFQKTSSGKEAIRQWRSYYVGFLFWEISLTIAWTKEV